MEKDDQKIVIYWSWKKTVSLIAAVLLVPTVFIWIFSLTLKTTIINPDYYKGVLNKADTYNRLIEDGIPSLIVGSKVSDDSTTDWFAKEMIVLVIEKAVDPAWLQTLTDKIIDQIVVFLSADNKTGKKVELDLGEASDLLARANVGLAMASQMVPSCSGSETGIGATACKNIDPEKVQQGIATVQQNITNYNLGVVDLSSEISEVNSAITFIQNFVRSVNSYFWFTTVFALILIAAIVLLNLKHVYYMTRFLAIPLAVTSALSFIVVLMLSPMASGDYSNVSFDLPSAMNSIIADILKYFTSGLFHRVEIITLIVLLIATAGYATMIVLEKNHSILRKK